MRHRLFVSSLVVAVAAIGAGCSTSESGAAAPAPTAAPAAPKLGIRPNGDTEVSPEVLEGVADQMEAHQLRTVTLPN